MTQNYMLGILMLAVCSLVQVSTFPSNNELTTTGENLTEVPEEKEERSLSYDETNIENDETTKEIIKRILAINEALKKPNKKHHVQWNAPPQTGGSYILDKDTLEKLQQVIASGKLQQYNNNLKQQESNTIINDDLDDTRYSRQISPVYQGQQLMPPMAYLTNMPVIVMPSTTNMQPYGNSLDFTTQYQTKQGPFGQIPWPFAQAFPILIRDPFLSIMNGGGFQNFIEVGQTADVCKRKQKSDDSTNEISEDEDMNKIVNHFLKSDKKGKSRGKRAVKKRTVSLENHVQDTNKANKFFTTKPTTTKPTKPEPLKNTKTADESEGDLRFPFLFGHKDKPPTGPGLYINRLKVRQGGVAIAGPGGVATAGRGGTAIVGPGGLAYTQPGGLAVAGPAARVIAITSEADLTSIAHRLQQQSTIDGSVSQLLRAIPEGKLVATDSSGEQYGSVTENEMDTNTEDNQAFIDTMDASVQYLPFYGGAKGQYLEIKKDINSGSITSEKIVSEENISSENIIKNSDGTLLGKVMAKNLQNMKTLSTSLLRLTNIGRKTGALPESDKARYKTQLASLGEAASNLIKLIEEINDVDVLFKKNSTLRKVDQEDDDYVADETVGIDAPSDDSNDFTGLLEQGTIAEAKPVGLAVVGENGIAASRPMATAVAAHGVAIAKPIATAIAGLDPTALGISFQINNAYSRQKN